MRKENNLLIFTLVGAGVIVILLYFLFKPTQSETTMTAGSPSGIPPQAQAVTGMPDQTAGGMNPGYGELTDEQIAIADIAIGKLLNSSQGITPPMITVKSFEAVDFPSSALGCPQDGMMYTEAIVSGHKVVLEAQGKEYDYRIGGAENVVLCEQ